MSQKNPPKKKVVVTTTKKKKSPAGNEKGNIGSITGKKKVKATATKARLRKTVAPKESLTFGKDNYIWMGIGVGLVALGLILMTGGQMPSPEVWDDNIIYSFRRTVLAPIVILAGLVLEIYAIFKGYDINQ